MTNKKDQRVEEFNHMLGGGVIPTDDWLKQAFTQTRAEAFDEALELVGEDRDRSKDTLAGGVENWHEAGYNGGYNQAKAELREALQAKIESV